LKFYIYLNTNDIDITMADITKAVGNLSIVSEVEVEPDHNPEMNDITEAVGNLSIVNEVEVEPDHNPEMNVNDCDVFEKVCDFILNHNKAKTLWATINDPKMSKEKLKDKRGRVYLLVVDDIVKKIGQTDDNSGIKNVAGYGVGNAGKPSDRTTGIHYYIGKQLLNNHKVSFYCMWCPKAIIISHGFNQCDEKKSVAGSFSAKDLENHYIKLHTEKTTRLPELNYQEDFKRWDNSIQEINKLLKSKQLKPLPEDIDICDDYWKLYHWKYNDYDLFPNRSTNLAVHK